MGEIQTLRSAGSRDVGRTPEALTSADLYGHGSTGRLCYVLGLEAASGLLFAPSTPVPPRWSGLFSRPLAHAYAPAQAGNTPCRKCNRTRDAHTPFATSARLFFVAPSLENVPESGNKPAWSHIDHPLRQRTYVFLDTLPAWTKTGTSTFLYLVAEMDFEKRLRPTRRAVRLQ